MLFARIIYSLASVGFNSNESGVVKMENSKDAMSESLGRGYLDSWDKKSSIRNLARRDLRHDSQRSYFPRHDQPLCSHPLIISLGEGVQQSILTQSAYKFMLGISEHETTVVTTAIQNAICNCKSLPDWLKQALQAVIIDEFYHAMIANDFIQQVQAITGDLALAFPKDSDLGRALARTLKRLPVSAHDSFTMVAVCVAENLITQELVARQTDPTVNPFFYEINRDHLMDEGRHAKLFTEVIHYIWSDLTLETRQLIEAELPSFIESWMRREVSTESDRIILRSLKLSDDEIEIIMDDTHPKLDFKTAAEVNPNIMHIERWLRRVGVWQRQENLWNVSQSKNGRGEMQALSADRISGSLDSSATVCSLLSMAILNGPRHIAIRTHDRQISYEDLDRALSALSIKLVRSGFSPGDRVGVYIRNRFDFICTILGIMKAGLTVVPLPSDGPTTYLKDVLEQANLSLIICDIEAQNSLDSLNFEGQIWLCDQNIFEGETLKVELSQPDGAACILFTSGTTGKPKGVVLLHNALAEFAKGAKDSFPLGPDDTILQFSNLSFDASLAELVNTVASGATLAIPSQDLLNSSAEFFQECMDLGVTVLNLPAAYWAQLVHENLEIPQNISIVLVYGESLNYSSLDRWYKTKRHAALINTYGPTEATIGTSYCHLDDHPQLRGTSQLIGTAFPGKTIYILDEFQELVLSDSIGEIYVGGLGVNAFYLTGRDVAPTPVFQNHPKFGRLYQTGDFGQWLECPDSGKRLLAFHGRRDRQVKISGSRVELEQVEHTLARHSEVAEALVLVRKQDDVSVLAAFVVKKVTATLSESDLVEFCETSLPRHTRPTTIRIIEHWPLTPRGKIDKNALLERLSSPVVEASNGLLISDELAKIWQSLLAVPVIKDDSHFFKLGGHSLLAMSLVGLVNDRWRAGLTLRQVIQSPTFRDMNRWLQDRHDSNKQILAPVISPKLQDTGPLSYGQEALLLIHRADAGNSIQYNVAFTITMKSEVNDAALNLALNHVINRQIALRVVFSWDGGKCSQKLTPLMIDLKREGVASSDFQKIIRDDARTPFKLSDAPPLRIRLFEWFDGSKLVLYMNVHHIVHDGLSIQILVEEIFKAYREIVSGEARLLPDLKGTYFDFVSAMRHKLEVERDKLMTFWRTYLQNTKPLTLPIRKKERGHHHSGASHLISLESIHVEVLRKRCFMEGVSFFAALFSGVMLAFRQMTGADDVTVGSIMSLREDQAFSRVVGMFVNTVLLRSPSSQMDSNLKEYILQAHASIIDVMTFRHTPLTMLIDELKLPRDAVEYKVFDTTVNYHPFGTIFEPSNGESIQGKVEFVDHGTTNVGLGIDFYEWGDHLQIRFGYCQNLYEREHIIALARQIRDILVKISQCDWMSSCGTFSMNMATADSSLSESREYNTKSILDQLDARPHQ